MQSDRDKILL